MKRLVLTALPITYMALIWIQSSYPIEEIKSFLGISP